MNAFKATGLIRFFFTGFFLLVRNAHWWRWLWASSKWKKEGNGSAQMSLVHCMRTLGYSLWIVPDRSRSDWRKCVSEHRRMPDSSRRSRSLGRNSDDRPSVPDCSIDNPFSDERRAWLNVCDFRPPAAAAALFQFFVIVRAKGNRLWITMKWQRWYVSPLFLSVKKCIDLLHEKMADGAQFLLF